MEFIERTFSITEGNDYAYNIRRRMLFYQAVEATPVYIVRDTEKVLAGWLLRRRRTFNTQLR